MCVRVRVCKRCLESSPGRHPAGMPITVALWELAASSAGALAETQLVTKPVDEMVPLLEGNDLLVP